MKSRQLYFLRTLLLYHRGAQSFEDLCTVDGHIYRYTREGDDREYLDFEQAAIQKGLVKDDLEWRRCLREATTHRMSREMRRLFTNISIDCDPSSPINLWNDFKNSMVEDIVHDLRIPADDAYNVALIEIEIILKRSFKKLDMFNLPNPTDRTAHTAWINGSVGPTTFDIEHELRECNRLSSQLNVEQRAIFDRVKLALDTNTAVRIFVDGPGGTGKTFLYKTICHLVRSRGEVILATEWSGMAAFIS
jgi:hypothetical protein